MNKDLSKFISVSNTLGKHVEYVQGGGGNTSLKTGEREMFIKASGMFLSDIEDETGFLSVDWQLLKLNIETCLNDKDYSMLLTQSQKVQNKLMRPSIETGFHALLDKCTIHTHSVWANLLTCSKEGQDYLRDLFTAAIWVPYATPGLELTRAISERLDGRQNVTLFLQNHGLVVSGPNPQATYDMHETVTKTVRKAFPKLSPFSELDEDLSAIELSNLLFPDQAIYHSSPELANSRAGRETIQAYIFLIDRIKKAELTPNFINSNEREVLLNMESEKFRQGFVKL